MYENNPVNKEWPKEWDHCPNCGSQDRVVQGVVDEEKASGHLPPEAWLAIPLDGIVVADKMRNSGQVPVIMPFVDICKQCGTIYCVYVDKKTGETHKQLPAPGFPFKGIFNNPYTS